MICPECLKNGIYNEIVRDWDIDNPDYECDECETQYNENLEIIGKKEVGNV